ncbi:MAG: flippase-like domain-containing protein [Deltaproteobacteria bacterium]|nr:flippase-like domain-containing protein [Deltaproteobacteria bacterium]
MGILALVSIHFFAEPFRWAVYLRSKNKEVLFSLIYIFSSTAFFSYILPAKLGIPLRFWLLKSYQKLSAATISVYMLADSTMSIVLWALASFIFGGHFAFDIIKQSLKRLEQVNTSLVVLIILGGMGLFFLLVPRRQKKNIHKNLKEVFCKLNWHQAAGIVLLFSLDIASYVLRHALIIVMVGGPYLEWRSIIAITVLSIFAGFISAMPMGLIGYDATIVLLLMQQGMSVEAAVSVPMINRAANLLVSVFLGIPSAIKLQIGFNVKELIRKLKLSKNV